MFLQIMLFPGIFEVFDWHRIVALFHSATATAIADEESWRHDTHAVIQRLART